MNELKARLKESWERFCCWVGFHGESVPCDSFTSVPTYLCRRCGREYEL